MSEKSIIIYDKTYNLQQKIHDFKFNFSATFKEISNTSDFDRFFLTPSHILADLFEKTSTLFYNLEASKITHLCSGSQSKSHLIATLT